MLKKYELATIIRDALLDLPDVSDKANEDGTYSIFDKRVATDENGDLIFTFTDEHGVNKEVDTYRITMELIESRNKMEGLL